MNIVMMTNTYKPLVGGLERSIETFSQEFRNKGHRVIIVAPEFEGMKPEPDVIRIPAVQHFNGSDFSVQLPIPVNLADAWGSDFKPDIVHAHHPFLIGDTALRVAHRYNVPLVFTHHTLYEHNVHYVPGSEEALKRFVVELATGYANLADQAFAPSESIMHLMQQRGVQTPIEVIPTGIYVEKFIRGDGQQFRKLHNIPPEAFVVGYLGRLAPEKNLEFLTRAIAAFMKKQRAHFLISGNGPSQEAIRNVLHQEKLDGRVHFTGTVKGKALLDAYHAMNVFAFASQSETQGLVLAEAMAAAVPVVAVDAPGVREVVHDRVNGRLIAQEHIDDFVRALEWVYRQSPAAIKTIHKACRTTAMNFAMKASVQKALDKYTALCIQQGFIRRSSEQSPWTGTLRLIHTQWEIVKNLTKAAGAMIGSKEHQLESVGT